MGEVWRARHRMLARPAAIKLIRPSLAGDSSGAGVSGEAYRRFEREAQVIARLRSPHTVELFDFGVAADGAFYYVMELLDGLDADKLLRRFGPTPPERAVFVLRQVCHSLSEAESCGLVHRDIKPANIFLCRYGEEFDFVKVLDFGIVKRLREGTQADLLRTGENAVQGTPAFMAPEQAMGTEVDGRADIYATGCVAYWLLTGKHVFTADTSIGLLMQHVQARPAPPSTRTDQPIPAALDRSCCRAWQRTLVSGPNRPGSCRAGSPRSGARADGPRTGRGAGGRRTRRRGCSRGRASRSRRGHGGSRWWSSSLPWSSPVQPSIFLRHAPLGRALAAFALALACAGPARAQALSGPRPSALWVVAATRMGTGSLAGPTWSAPHSQPASLTD